VFPIQNNFFFFVKMNLQLILSLLKMQKYDSKSLIAASTVHNTSKILLFFEFLLFYVPVHGDTSWFAKFHFFFVSTILIFVMLRDKFSLAARERPRGHKAWGYWAGECISQNIGNFVTETISFINAHWSLIAKAR
jgi:hypothetical protein